MKTFPLEPIEKAPQKELRALQLDQDLPALPSDRVDRVLLHPVAGSVILAVLLFLLFQAVFAWAETPMGLIESSMAWLGEQVGKYIPAVFFAWDGHNGDAGRKMAVSAFYYLVLQPSIPKETYIYPTLIAVGIVILEGWILTRRANRKKGKA